MEIKSNKYWNFSIVFLLVFSGFTLAYLAYILVLFQANFFQSCPNKEFLTWDPSLRFIQTLKMMDNLRNFRIFHFLFQILDSPTWPVLRNIFQIPVFFLYGIDQFADIQITFVFLVLLLLVSGVYLFREISGEFRFILFPVFFLFACVLILLSPAIAIYSFTGMLEIQGAVFFIFSVLAISMYYRESHPKSKWFVLASTLLLFHTKYPYGYMLALSAILFQFVLEPKEFIMFCRKYIGDIFSSFKNIYRLVVACILLIVYVLPLSSSFPGKTKNYIKFLVFLILSIDFILYFFRNKKELLESGFEKLIFIFQWVVFPVLFWILIHPDRFSSSGSTIALQQTEGVAIGQAVPKDFAYFTIYLKEIAANAFHVSVAGWIILALTVFALGFGYYGFRKYSRINASFILAFYLLAPVAFLTFLTTNHQARHVYHLIPAFVLCALIFLFEFIRKFSKTVQAGILVLALLPTLYFANVLNKFSGNANVCFSGKDRTGYSLPIQVRDYLNTVVPLDKSAILVNDINPDHVNRADVELIFSIEAYKKRNQIITNPKNGKRFGEFSELFFVGNDCTPQESMKKIQSIMDKKYLLVEKQKFSGQHYCLVRYGIQKLDPALN